MALKKVKRKALSVNPSILLLYGAPKVGKTTMLSSLDDCLIIDTENGSRMVGGYIHNVNSKEELLELYKEASAGHEYKYFALDTIDKIVEWTEQSVMQEHQVDAIADMPFGKGFGIVRTKVLNNIKKLQTLCPNVIIIGHRKTAAAIDNSQAIEPESLDISGKLKNMIMAMCDAVGYVHRDEEDNLMISFKSKDSLEAGSRCPHLKGKIVPFDWSEIYKEEGGGNGDNKAPTK
jgi:hypothetical protein